jgi:hypothetical protein
MGVAPDMILDNKNVYRLLVLLALASVVVNFFFPALKSHALPNTVAMYSIRPVNYFDKNLYVSTTSEDNIQKLALTDIFLGARTAVHNTFAGGKYNAHGLTEIQMVKYLQGCYGDMFEGAKGQTWTDLGLSAQSSLSDYVPATNLLNAYQDAQGSGDSVCTCIDDMFAASLELSQLGYTNKRFADYDVNSDNALSQTELDKYKADTGDTTVTTTNAASAADFNTYVTNRNTLLFKLPVDYDAAMNNKKYLANTFSFPTHTDFSDAGKRAKYHQDITRLCVDSAIPMHRLAYEDTAPTALLAMIGQLLLILAAVQIHSSFVHWDAAFDNPEGFADQHKERVKRKQQSDYSRGGKSGVDFTTERETYKDELTQLQWLKGLFAVGIVAVLLWQSISEYNLFNNTDSEFMNFRKKENRHMYSPVITIIFYAVTGVAVLVTLMFEFFMLKAHTKILQQEQEMKVKSKIPALWTFHRNGNTAMVLKHIASDVPLIAGFCLLGIAVLMQCNVTATHTVVGLTLLLAVAGFLQHISNVIKGLYTRICARLEAKLVTQLTLYDLYTDEGHGKQMVQNQLVDVRKLNPEANSILQMQDSNFANEKQMVESNVRPVLQYFGYSRLYIFLIVLIATFVFIFVAKDTTHLHTLHTMLDGQLLYFTIAFLICNVGFDILYELLPFMFENCCTDNVRVFVILLYVIFFNSNQMLYFFRLPSA